MYSFWRDCTATAALLMLLTSCNSSSDKPTLFEAVAPEESGITFINQIVENDSLNVIDYAYIYNGGGLGVGDVNNDGLKDLFFAGNMVDNKLYLNKGKASGHFEFEDISEQAGININRWCTGVAMVDINQDGHLDIYVSVANKFNREASRNLLYVNNGDGIPTFTEMAKAYGLDDNGYSTQAAFFDYDKDGDLDMYLLTNGMEPFNHNNTRPKKIVGEGVSNDKMYRNDTPLVPPSRGEDRGVSFTDITKEAGILKEGYGLGITVNDINQDGWPDVYAANDFITNDLMWMNNGQQDSLITFSDKAPDYLKHQTHNGMGTDIADYNNDGLVDIIVLDMLPEDNQRQKSMLAKPNYEKFELTLDLNYTPQYMRNTLQLNNGMAPDGSMSFSEIGQLAGVYKTDWSWSALFADYDNDGYRDLLITNGYVRDVTDLDYIMYQSSASQFGTQESRKASVKELASKLKEAKIHNYIYRNNHDLTFEDQSEEWGIATPSFSNGTVFADLDNDGDLDLVMNNINDPAFVYENKAESKGNHFLKIKLKGSAHNQAGLGAKITLWYDGQQQYHYHTIYRGYKSTVDADPHFGLGQYIQVDSLWIVWPDGKSQKLQNVKADQTLALAYTDAVDQKLPEADEVQLLLERTDDQIDLDYKHQENDFIDFRYQTLLPRMYSQDGPALAIGDINGDGRDDFYVGGAKDFASTFFTQLADGSFEQKNLEDAINSEDMGALFFDADQDGDLDLYVVSGGNEYHEKHEAYQDRLYLNDGQGNFSREDQALPKMLSSGSCVVAADYDQDGDLDLFVGGRLRPQQYPLPPRSYLLRNEGGKFTDVTAEVAPALENIGLVTSALWSDYDADGKADLIVTGEWMPITFLHNEGDSFKNMTAETALPNTSGWWNSLLAGDFDHDGDMDYVAGNLGLNSNYKASEQQPVSIYVKDFDQNNTIDPIMAHYIMGEEYPAPSRDALIGQIADMRRKFPRFEMYGQAHFSDVFTEQELEGAYVLKSKRMESSYLENLGNGKFNIRALPLEAQFAPIYGMLAEDVNADGHLDLLCVGNSYATEIQSGWYDAGIGNVLLGNGKGGFMPASMQESGFYVDSDARAMVALMGKDQQLHYIISSNADSLKAFTPQRSMTEMMIIPLEADDFYATVELKDGSRYRQEFHYGESYLSQSTRNFCISRANLEKITIHSYQGDSREVRPASEVLSQQR
ncbi:VCBS repeat-containing protein [Catalinimonas niigatensis]|uniref:VCBS repeat-containing protein n=1 Tax=Catalinimonas niigatensis TaxID=1397264 RepID=UPI002666EF5F|nr:VCBS repeat-containing protein [Catalinimonas niigatensis]WPP52659.1 VCBS repeat-containing protein [Catalinimonas niigatensis]